MRNDELHALATVILGAVGTYLLLPHAHGRLKPHWAHIVGGVLTAIAILLLAGFWTTPGPGLQSFFFYGFGLAALVGAVLMVTSRNPVYSALWFASVVLSTSGLFLLAGAQFLAAGTVIVYAGAIIVTFLFVIMLAQSEGLATYDRAARAPVRSTLSCYLLLWGLLFALIRVKSPESIFQYAAGSQGGHEAPEMRLVPAWVRADRPDQERLRVAIDEGRVAVLNRAVPTETSRLRYLPGAHVAGLGGTLYTDYLIVVELAGALLFVALVGAAAIATPKPPVRPMRAGQMPGPLEAGTLRGD